MRLADINDSFSKVPSRFSSTKKVQSFMSKVSETHSQSTNLSLISPKVETQRRTRPDALGSIESASRKYHHSVIKSLNQTSTTFSRMSRQYRKRESSNTQPESARLHDLKWSSPSSRYDKKNPPSLYSSSRNLQSFEHHTVQQEVLNRISVIGSQVEAMAPGAKKQLTRPLKEVFQYCVETEIKSYYHVWFKLLNTFEHLLSTITKKPAKTQQSEETSVIISDVDHIMNKECDFEDSKGDTMAGIVKDLSKLWRTATHKVTTQETFLALETIWNALVKLLNKSISAQSARVNKAFESIQEQTRLERNRQKRLMEMMMKNYDDKCVRASAGGNEPREQLAKADSRPTKARQGRSRGACDYKEHGD
jgi:hypothetical protein